MNITIAYIRIFFLLVVSISNISLYSSAIKSDRNELLDTVQADIQRIKFGLTELQERTLYLQKPSLQAFCASYDNTMFLQFGGKCTEEMFSSQNLTFLNNNVPNDSSFFMRATGDMFMDAWYGQEQKPRILYHSTVRTRFKWGSGAEVKVDGESIPVLDASVQSRGGLVNKHLLWTREMWIKFALGDIFSHAQHYLELGSFPYQVGRGISLGAAYKSAGFLGFTPSFSIDQFAPAILLHIEPSKTFFAEGYISLLDNQSTSYKANNAKIRLHELHTSPTRGTGRQSYTAVLKGFWNVIAKQVEKLSFEPYIVYFQSLDQKLEFNNDVDSFVTTYGFALEGKKKKLDWGFEAALNHGNVMLKGIDRNHIKFARTEDGLIAEQYTKVYSENPALVDKPTPAVVTNQNKATVDGSLRDPFGNGKEIGTSGLYNAYDRFRPEQQELLSGYMFIADFAYQVIDSVLNIAAGAGYASGHLNQQRNANKETPEQLMNIDNNGFVTLQSIYSGTRLRHLIILNEGVPRFDVQNPNKTFKRQNVTPPLTSSQIEFTNIAFAGTRLEWQIREWKKYKAIIAPNVISYWAPLTPNTKSGEPAGNYMGTELTTEISAQFYKKFKLYGYIGVLFPGTYYDDMYGTPYMGETTGNNIGYLANIGASFSF